MHGLIPDIGAIDNHDEIRDIVNISRAAQADVASIRSGLTQANGGSPCPSYVSSTTIPLSQPIRRRSRRPSRRDKSRSERSTVSGKGAAGPPRSPKRCGGHSIPALSAPRWGAGLVRRALPAIRGDDRRRKGASRHSCARCLREGAEHDDHRHRIPR
jgi:hypothetical protein